MEMCECGVYFNVMGLKSQGGKVSCHSDRVCEWRNPCLPAGRPVNSKAFRKRDPSIPLRSNRDDGEQKGLSFPRSDDRGAHPAIIGRGSC
jgi:hypothetical protein